jgi:hypothetical protein
MAEAELPVKLLVCFSPSNMKKLHVVEFVIDDDDEVNPEAAVPNNEGGSGIDFQ